MNKFLISYLLLAAAISGCGGGGKLTETPATTPLATTEFIALASAANCANLRNRMFVIDQKHVVWDKAGSCADASYELVLFGKTTKDVLCSSADTIAGPKTTCTDAQYRSTFDLISKNLDKADLGLGSTHQVQQLVVPPGASWAMSFMPVYAPLYYGKAPDNVVIKDISAWDKFLAEAQFKPVFAPLTQADFSGKMVLGVFFKYPNNCSVVKIVKVSSNGQKMTVEYTDQELISAQSCDPNSSLASTPMNLVLVDKVDLPVEFVNVNAAQIAFSTLDVTIKQDGLNTGFQGAIKDAAAWADYVSKNIIGTAPTIDFTKNMVVAATLSLGGCKSFDGITLWRSSGKLNVAVRINDNANPNIACTADFIQRTQLIELARTDDAIEFSTVRGAYLFDPGAIN
jgi:hypothetical protein